MNPVNEPGLGRPPDPAGPWQAKQPQVRARSKPRPSGVSEGGATIPERTLKATVRSSRSLPDSSLLKEGIATAAFGGSPPGAAAVSPDSTLGMLPSSMNR